MNEVIQVRKNSWAAMVKQKTKVAGLSKNGIRQMVCHSLLIIIVFVSFIRDYSKTCSL